VVEGTSLENWRTGNGIESSNLSLSVLHQTRWRPRRVVVCGTVSAVQLSGRVAEWFKAHAWKVCVR
jgi:hypothetical protein